MATVDNSKFDELCRLCGTKTTMIIAIHIYENEGNIRQISKKIDSCLPIQVHEQDELPKMICENCLYKLELLYDFRDRTIRTERLLLELNKELKNLNHQQCIVSMDNHELIMVQHHPLLSEHNLQNVSQIDLSHLNQREGIIVEHEIILTPHNVDINSASLDSIELNNHDLTSQELSNQSLQTQDSIMVDSSSHEGFTEENLNLMQQQLLNDQFRLQHELQVTMANENSVSDFRLPNDMKHELQQAYSQDKSNESHSMNSMDYADSKIDENSLTVDTPLNVDSQLNSIKLHIYTSENLENNEIPHMRHDDSNSCNSLLVDEQINSVDAVIDKQGYILQRDDHNLTPLSPSFYCNICLKGFEQKAQFESHYETHFYKCSLCFALCATENLLMAHRKEFHDFEEEKTVPKPLQEPTTPPRKEEILQHSEDSIEYEYGNVKDEGDEEDEEEENADDIRTPDQASDATKKKKWSPKVCKECGKSYKTNYKLQEHMRKHTGEKPYKCGSCEKAFRSKIGLAQHEAKHTGQYDYSCPTCGKGFQCKSYLMVHQRVHSDIKPYPCTTCGQNFKTKQSLLDHTNRHLGVKPYMCDICGRGFITKGLCRAHQKIHSGLDNRKYSCKICAKMFVSKSYLQTHLRIHTGEKPFMCEVCGKGFLTRVDLKIHSTMHTGEKSYVCEMCGKAFARRDALRCHRRSHTGERPYSCDLCGQTFTQFTPMAIHKRLHTGERPYACETCGKTFVSRSTMMCHAKKHVKVENKPVKFETIENT